MKSCLVGTVSMMLHTFVSYDVKLYFSRFSFHQKLTIVIIFKVIYLELTSFQFYEISNILDAYRNFLE